MRRDFALVVAAALFTTGLALVPAPAAAAPALGWQKAVGAVGESSPLAVDLDGDGRREIVFGSLDSRVYALRADGSAAPGWSQPVSDPVSSSASAADADGNGRPDLFIGSGTAARTGGAVYSFAPDGRVRFRFAASDPDFASPAIHSTPALGDIRPDGVLDLSVGSLSVRSIWSLNANGAVQPGFPFYADDTVFSSAALADVSGDGVAEMIIGSDSSPGGPVDHRGGMVRAITGDGRVVWEYRVNDMVRSSPSVGDIDGDGRPEVVFGTGDYWRASDSVKVFALGLDGRLKAGWPKVTDGPTYGSPALADLDGNGRLDVVMGTFGGPTGAGGSVYAWTGSGADLPGYPRASGGGVVLGSIVTADVDGDGGQDLFVPTGGGVFVYSGKTGARLFALLEGQVGFQNSPLVTDLEGDGRLDVILAGTKPSGGGAVYRFLLDPVARFGDRGWHQFRKDDRRTGSWTTPPTATARSVASACPASRVPPSGFVDVVAGSTHESAIDCVVAWEIAFGSAGRYQPWKPLPRDQMARFVARLIAEAGASLPAGPDAFPDDEGSTHEASINALAAAGVVNGQSNGTFGPAGHVTRAQMATFLVRAWEYTTGTALPAGPDYFLDDGFSPHAANIDKAARAGFTGGAAGGIFRPLGDVGRDQMASFLTRLLDKLVVDDGSAVPF